jgi:hypothetical protein
MEIVNNIVQTVTVFFASVSVAPTYIQAGAIVILLFLLVVSLAQFRQHFVKWSMKGGLVGLFFGILLTLILEGFLLISGHTALTGVLGWKTAPKPISTALDLGKEKLTNVLGVGTDNPTSNDVITIMQSLPPSEISKIKAIICTP